MVSLTADEQVEIQLRLLRGRYLRSMVAQMATLETVVGQCEHGPLRTGVGHQLRVVAHRLAGTGKIYGFAAISEHALELDDEMAVEPGIADDALCDLTRRLLDACRAAQNDADPADVGPPPATLALPKASKRGTMLPLELPLVLVADDDEAVRELFVALIGLEAYVITAANSDEALRLMRKYQPDVLILDDMMPGAIGGLDFLEKLKRSHEFDHVATIVVSASTSVEDIGRGLAAGATTYITKPFRPSEVLSRIREVLVGLTLPPH